MLADYSFGYSNLRPQLRHLLTESIIRWNQEHGSRILIKNIEGNWAESDPSLNIQLTQKELAKASNGFKKYLITWSDYLIAETRYGYWRETSMTRYLIPSLLFDLQDELVGYASEKETGDSEPHHTSTMKIWSRIAGLGPKPDFVLKRAPFPPSPKVQEPYPGAWLKVGDKCEVANVIENDKDSEIDGGECK